MFLFLPYKKENEHHKYSEEYNNTIQNCVASSRIIYDFMNTPQSINTPHLVFVFLHHQAHSAKGYFIYITVCCFSGNSPHTEVVPYYSITQFKSLKVRGEAKSTT